MAKKTKISKTTAPDKSSTSQRVQDSNAIQIEVFSRPLPIDDEVLGRIVAELDDTIKKRDLLYQNRIMHLLSFERAVKASKSGRDASQDIADCERLTEDFPQLLSACQTSLATSLEYLDFDIEAKQSDKPADSLTPEECIDVIRQAVTSEREITDRLKRFRSEVRDHRQTTSVERIEKSASHESRLGKLEKGMKEVAKRGPKQSQADKDRNAKFEFVNKRREKGVTWNTIANDWGQQRKRFAPSDTTKTDRDSVRRFYGRHLKIRSRQ